MGDSYGLALELEDLEQTSELFTQDQEAKRLAGELIVMDSRFLADVTPLCHSLRSVVFFSSFSSSVLSRLHPRSSSFA